MERLAYCGGQLSGIVEAYSGLTVLDLGNEGLGQSGPFTHFLLSNTRPFARRLQVTRKDHALSRHQLFAGRHRRITCSFFPFGVSFRHIPRWHPKIVVVCYLTD